MKEKFILGSCCIITLVALAAWAPSVSAYESYQTANGALDNCSQCHPGFDAGFGGPLHSAHTAYTSNCTACHMSPGQIPVFTDESGTPGGLGCSGCHQGGGLQLHHTNAEVPPDSDGLSCATSTCHPGATSPPESTPPAYYGDAAITSIVDPCQSTPAPPGEDFDGDNFGLDNDGNLLYDQDDPACAELECIEDSDCDDSNVCNGIETCDPVEGCQPGIILNCDDGNLCTIDSCDPVSGCANVPVECSAGEQCDPADGQCKPEPGCTVDADCDNGFFCDGAETCDTASGTCQNGTPPDCDDGVDCTADTCDEVNDECAYTPNDVFCDDSDVCNGSETCDATLGCQEGTPLNCEDGDLCTTDSCDAVAGCAFTPVECPAGEQCDSADGICKPEPGCTVDADCDNGFFCDGTETCDAATGTCQAGTPPDCDDGVDCTVDTCDEVNDECANTPDDFACPDDGLFCTGQETCDPAAGCVSSGDPCPAGTTCNEDADTCNMVTEKVTICHIPPGNPAKARTLTINAESVADHLGHGDVLGTCP